MAQIFCFGDSITYGAWDVAGSGWAQGLRMYLDKKQEEDDGLYFLIYNLGIPGETTDGLINRFLSETKARIREERQEENIFIFAYGANDAAVIPSQNKFRVDIKNFENNLENVIDQAKKFGNKIFILNITPVNEEFTASPVNKDKSRLNKYIEIYNEKIKKIADNKNIYFIDINSAFMANDYKSLFCEDGLHPNKSGHKIIFNELLKSMKSVMDLDG
ncbi:MAG TPA: SGNH/GDSL hydrolase family protein [bacterium]|nr:SGNH/GDSL hydrolase family protein [bacterium]HPV65519.1 SGNH/GDSL hydrolase family protein [bacterium]